MVKIETYLHTIPEFLILSCCAMRIWVSWTLLYIKKTHFAHSLFFVIATLKMPSKHYKSMEVHDEILYFFGLFLDLNFPRPPTDLSKFVADILPRIPLYGGRFRESKPQLLQNSWVLWNSTQTIHDFTVCVCVCLVLYRHDRQVDETT